MFKFEDKEIEVKAPTVDDHIQARLFSGGIFRQATEQKVPPPTQDQLEDHLIKLGLWSDEKKERIKELSKLLQDGELQLARGGRTKEGEKFTKEQAKELALKMIELRNEQYALAIDYRKYNYLSLEGIVEDATHNFLVYCCSYINGQRIYSSYEDYMSKQNTELAFLCSKELSKILYGDGSANDPSEIQFLKKYNFVNSDLRFINANGDLVDVEGKRVNDKGQYVNESGEAINESGEKIDENGNPIVEFVEFE